MGEKGERVKGIEPSYAACEAAVLPLNYTRVGTVENLMLRPGSASSLFFLVGDGSKVENRDGSKVN